MSKLTDSDIERLGKWCERPDGVVPYNAICRLFDDYEALRAQRDELAEALRNVLDHFERSEAGFPRAYELRVLSREHAHIALAKLEVKS